jgi:trk system potassium uptake protein TrkA
MKKRVVVIGLGIFGVSVVKELHHRGVEVIAVDKEKEAVQLVRDFSTKAIVADGTDKSVMDSIGLRETDTVIVSFGEDLAASTLITLHLKQMNVGEIIVKAPNDEHKLILEKVGASEVIIPEKLMADKLVRSLVSPNVLDYIPLSEDYQIYEIAPPSSFRGKSIGDLDLRKRFNMNVIAIRDILTDKVQMVPAASFVVKDSDVLLVICREADLARIQ